MSIPLAIELQQLPSTSGSPFPELAVSQTGEQGGLMSEGVDHDQEFDARRYFSTGPALYRPFETVVAAKMAVNASSTLAFGGSVAFCDPCVGI